jgi:Uma2 family endonuclease
MATQARTQPMTVEEWLESADVPEGARIELVDGELVMPPLPAYSHEKILYHLDRIFVLYAVHHPDVIKTVMRPARVPIPGENEGRHPDMALYGEEPADPDSPLAWTQIRPFLVIEVVSPGQGRRDYVEKYASYHLAQIPEYWIVDPGRRSLLALRWAPEQWEHHSIEGQGTYTTPLLPGLTLEVAELWR